MLHGNIKINGVVIGEWTAKRRHSQPKSQFNTYDCTISYRGLDGYNYNAEWEIWGVHALNGAISLAARVLQEGMVKAERSTNNTLSEDAVEAMNRALENQ